MTRSTSSIAVGLAFACVALPACSGRPQPAAAVRVDPIPVTVSTVTMADVAGTFEAGGVVQAQTTATIMARIVAPVLETHAVSGQRVRAGQVLLVLDGRELAAQARGARAAGVSAEQEVMAAGFEREAAESALALARATHARIDGLHARRSATPQELDEVTAALRAAEARAASAAARARAAGSGLEGARAASEAAETTDAFSRIRAPFDGVVTQKMVEAGNMAAPGAPLMRLEDTRSFRLDVHVDASRVGAIALGTTVPVVLGGTADDASSVVNGTVTEIGRAVDADARSFLVKIALPPTLPSEGGLRSGMFGRARFSTRPRSVLTVPAGALVHNGQVTSVFVVEKDIARMRMVSVSDNEVLAGLDEGDVVIVSPPRTVADGSRVRHGDR